MLEVDPLAKASLPPHSPEATDEDWAAKSDEADLLFSPGTPIEIKEQYSGRRAQIGDLLEAVKERGQHAVLFGERGVGKTSTSKIFRDLIPSTIKNVTVNRVRTYKTDTFSKLWHRIFENMRVSVKVDGRKKLVSVSDILERTIGPDVVLKELSKAYGHNDVPIIIIDEFQEMKDEQSLVAMSNLIKSLSDENVNVTILVVGVSDSVGDLIKQDKSVERCLTQVRMPRMMPDELESILDNRIPKLGMEITDEAVWRIVCLSRKTSSMP